MVDFNKITFNSELPALKGSSSVSGNAEVDVSIFNNDAENVPQDDDKKNMYYKTLNETLEGKYLAKAEAAGIPVASLMYSGVSEPFDAIKSRYPDAEIIAYDRRSPVVKYSDNEYEYLLDGDGNTEVTNKTTGQKQLVSYCNLRNSVMGIWVFDYDAEGNNIIGGKHYTSDGQTLRRSFEYNYNEEGSVTSIKVNYPGLDDEEVTRQIEQEDGRVFRPAIDNLRGAFVDDGLGDCYIGCKTRWQPVEE